MPTRPSVLIAACATLTLLAPVGLASLASDAISHEATRVAPGLGGGSMSPDDTGACSGSSPLRPVCTSGVYQVNWAFVRMGLSAFNYQGTLENRLDWGYGALVLSCDIQGGAAQCSFDGPFPPADAYVLHNCRSYQTGTSVPGGSGSWSCNVTAG